MGAGPASRRARPRGARPGAASIALAVLWLAVVASSGRPFLYAQVRPGRGGADIGRSSGGRGYRVRTHALHRGRFALTRRAPPGVCGRT